MSRSFGWPSEFDAIDRFELLVLDGRHRALLVDNHLHRLRCRSTRRPPGRCWAKQHRFGTFELAHANDGDVFVRLEGVLETSRADGGRNRAVALLHDGRRAAAGR